MTEEAGTIEKVDIPHSECAYKAVSDSIKSICGIEVTPTDQDMGEVEGGIIIALISLVGDLDWSVFIGLPANTAEALAEKFAGFQIPFDSPDMGDAVGELANIIVGDIKAKLDREKIRVEISLPSVLRADNLQVLLQSQSKAVKKTFESELGNLWAGIVNGKTSEISL